MVKEVENFKKMDILNRSKELVNLYFSEKVDLGNHPYSNHLYHVSKDFEEDEIKSLALLHDLLEDTEVTTEDLKEMGYNESFIQVLVLLTNDLPSYDDYIDRLVSSNNIVAMQIKLQDLLHNMDVTRLSKLKPKDIKRVREKYIKAYLKIVEALERRG